MAISEIDVTEQGSSRKGPPCSVCHLLATLPPTEAAALEALLADPRVRYAWLSDQLEDEGHHVSAYVLGRHTRGQCDARTKLR